MSRYRVVAERRGFYAQYWTGSGWSHHFWSARQYTSRTSAEEARDEIEAGQAAPTKAKKQDWSTRRKNAPPQLSVEEIPYNESP